MNDPNSTDLLNGLCKQFDSAWQSPTPPSIESYAKEVNADRRSELLEHLIQIELHWRSDQEPSPTEAEFVRRFPEHQSAVHTAFQAYAEGDSTGHLWATSSDDDQSILQQGGGHGAAQTRTAAQTHGTTKGQTANQLDDHSIDTTNEPAEFELGSTIDQSLYQARSVADHDEFGTSDEQLGLSRSRSNTRSRKREIEDPSRPKFIDKFRIRRTLGKGAFGVVYLARDEELQRDVAIKVSLVSSDKLQAQMRQEAAKLAQLESPGIVPVYHIGTTDDQAVYIVQKYIKGYTLRDLIKKRTLSPARAAQLTQAIAQNLEAAHLRDILHRDLKPDNILIDDVGKPWIADFGLAISEEEQLERGPELAGTLPYMSPEQVRGRVDFLDPRSDIWALGVMYYEMLTGKRPFTGKSRESFSEQICQLDPRPLQQRAPGHLTSEMNAIFLKCCEKKPSDRYATVRELSDDLTVLISNGLSNQNIAGAFMSPELGDSIVELSDQSRRSSGHSSPGSANLSADKASTSASLKTPLVRGIMLTAGLIGLVAMSVIGTVIAISHYLPKPVALVQPKPSDSNAIGDSAEENKPDHLADKTIKASATKSLSPITTTEALPSIASEKPAALENTAAIVVTESEVSMDVDAQIDKPNDESLDPKEPLPTLAPVTGKDDVDAETSSPESAEKMDAPSPVETTKPAEQPKPAEAKFNGSIDKPWVVAMDGSGSHQTIQAALDEEVPDAVIELRPGVYNESLIIRMPTTIRGTDGANADRALCRIVSARETTVTVDCDDLDLARLSNLTIDSRHGSARAKATHAIDLISGTVVLDDCNVISTGKLCVTLASTTRFGARKCEFVSQSSFAVVSDDQPLLQIIECRFPKAGLKIDGGRSTSVSRSQFTSDIGIEVSRRRSAVKIDKCEFRDNSDTGIKIDAGGKVDATGSTWSQSKQAITVTNGTCTVTNDCSVDGGELAFKVQEGDLKLADVSIQDVPIGLQHAGKANVGLKHVRFDNCDQFTNSLGMSMRLIRAGEFRMGSRTPAGKVPLANSFPHLDPNLSHMLVMGVSNEYPVHKVAHTSDFYLSATEITVGQFRQFVDATNYRTDSERSPKGGGGFRLAAGKSVFDPQYSWKNPGFAQDDNHPVTLVTWNDANEFCKWLSDQEGCHCDLPSEAQWEYACRAGTDTAFHTGDAADSVAKGGNTWDLTAKEQRERVKTAFAAAIDPAPVINRTDGFVFTAPVGTFTPNKFGLFDMHGNVSEWCRDLFDKDMYSKSKLKDPEGPVDDPANSRARVSRGGGWVHHAIACRSAVRTFYDPKTAISYQGFRILVKTKP
ncbi:SUMF1/EgtB/PvdO family nonheme iron enzyme [Stieleria marina]|uniref:Serine/threonine-protein kinase PknB n=1 Tax=Stieleria marina TaxID=1930275 RepID=A0A517NMN7_9BACT|nr:Serine/threonine-protein kinase PknB [Planctomycetes bacterium K23_9]